MGAPTLCSERVNRSLADPAAMARADLSVAQLLMSVAFDDARWQRHRYLIARDIVIDARTFDDAAHEWAFAILDEAIESRAFARDCRETVRYLGAELARLTS